MAKGIASWTDVDYAQAAIDMLPGTVEEIEEFLAAQKIGPTCRRDGNRCPIAKWVIKWTGHVVYAGTYNVYMGEHVGQGQMIPYPEPVWRFISRYDSKSL